MENHTHHEQASDKVVDPVCGMKIDRAKAAGSSTVDGTAYYFCAKNCKEKFDVDPSAYGVGAPPSAQGPRTWWGRGRFNPFFARPMGRFVTV